MNLILRLFFLSLYFFVDAQIVNPNEIREKIYTTLFKDISDGENIKMVIDPTINKFDSYEMNEFGLTLDSVIYVNDKSICNNVTPYKCVSKFEIDRYTISNIYKEGKEEVSPIFYGVYPAIDSWYNLIYNAAVNHFEKNKTFRFQVILPVRKVWIENKLMKENMIFYKFWFDEKFETLKFNKKVVE